MKKLLMFCLTGMTVAAMAAELPVEIKTQKDIQFWGNKKYYETVNVTAENGAAKITVEKTVPDVKPIGYSFCVQSKQSLKAGQTYTLSFTLKSNMDVRVWCSVSAKMQGKFTAFGGISAMAELTADKAQSVEMQFAPKEDFEGQVRVPSLWATSLKEGQTLEISNVKLSDEAAAVPAAVPVEFKTQKDLVCWGSKKYYETVNVSVENGAAKVAVEKTVPDAKPVGYSFGIRSKQVFKADKTYILTFTLKSNMDVKPSCSVQMLNKPYTRIGGIYFVPELTANTPRTITLKFTPKEDCAAPTRLPSVNLSLKEGQTVELSDVKLAEMDAAK